MSKLKNLKEKLDSLTKELNDNFKNALKEETDIIFNKYPKLKKFSWEQYTPYFYDGNPCEFSIKPYSLEYTYGKFSLSQYDHSAINSTGKFRKQAAVDEFKSIEEAIELETTLRDFLKILETFEKTCQIIFGEGRVTLTPTDINVEECDHD